MSKLLPIFIISLLLSLTTTLLAAPIKFDGSSAEAYQSSVITISRDLSYEQRTKLYVAILKLKLKGINSASEIQNKPNLVNGAPSAEFLKSIDGLTYREIIALAESTSNLQVQIKRNNGVIPKSSQKEPKFAKLKNKPLRPVKPSPTQVNYGLDPIYIEEPIWPSSAIINGQNGWVYIEFQLDEVAQPVNVSVIDSSPGTLFVKSALNSVQLWTFELPEEYDKNKKYKYLMEFKIEEDSSPTSYDPGFKGDVAKLPISTLTINNSKIDSIDDEQITMSLDYSLEPYHQGDRIYGCQIVFKNSENEFMPIGLPPEMMCTLTKGSGTKIISSPLPDDYELDLMNGELKFMIVVMQRVDDRKYQLIGMTRFYNYKLKGFSD